MFHKTNPSALQDGNLKIRSKISAACRYDFQQVKYLTSNGRRRQLSEKPKFAPQRRRAQNINRHWSAAPRQTQLGSWLVCPNTIFRRRARSPFLFYDLPIFLDRRPTMMLAIPLNGVLSVLAAILRTSHFKKGTTAASTTSSFDLRRRAKCAELSQVLTQNWWHRSKKSSSLEGASPEWYHKSQVPPDLCGIRFSAPWTRALWRADSRCTTEQARTLINLDWPLPLGLCTRLRLPGWGGDTY